MKENVPEKIYLSSNENGTYYYTEGLPFEREYVEYTHTDAFIEKALKWYCRDCECNDNCKDSKCFFYREYECYLKGDTNAIPPKYSDSILNEDGSTSDNWRYRHFISRMQDDFIEKACEWLAPVFKDLAGYYSGAELLDDFKNYMTGE